MTSKTKISRGNLTVVPKHVRKSLGLGPGDLLEWSVDGGLVVVRPGKRRRLDDVTAMIAAGVDAVEDKKRAQRGGR